MIGNRGAVESFRGISSQLTTQATVRSDSFCSRLGIFCEIGEQFKAFLFEEAGRQIQPSKSSWRQCLASFCRLPTPIQAETVPLILGGGDVMAVGAWNRAPAMKSNQSTLKRRRELFFVRLKSVLPSHGMIPFWQNGS